MSRKPKYAENKQLKIGTAALSADAAGRKALMAQYGISKATLSRYSTKAEEFAGVSLFSEMGTTGLNRFGGTVLEDYNNDWNSLVDMVALVKEMLNHPVVGATMYALETSIKRVDWSVVAGGETPLDLETAKFVETCLHDMSHSWEDHTSQLVSMLAYGFAPFEIIYKRRLGPDKAKPSQFDDGRIGWRKLAFRSQDTLAPGNEWVFDDAGGVQGMNQQAPPTWEPKFIPINKMLLYRTTAAKNNPQGRSVLRDSYIAWYYSKNISEIEGIAAERVGAGIPVMYLGDGTSKGGGDSDVKFAKQIVRDTRSDEQEGIVIPHPKQTADGRGALFELVSPPSRGLIDFEATIERYDKQITQTLLAQFLFLGLVKHGTQGLASVMVDFFAKSVEGWLITIAGTINRFLIPGLIRVNGIQGLTKYPQIEPGDVGETDVSILLEAMEKAVASGTLIPDEGTERRVRQVLRVPPRDSIEAGELLMDLPGGKQPIDPNANPFGGGGGDDGNLAVPPRREQFAKVRGRGAGAARDWEKDTNSYQRELRDIYSVWSQNLATDVDAAEDDSEREEIIAAEFAWLEAKLTRLSNARIRDGVELGLGDEFSMTPDVRNAMEVRQFEHAAYIGNSLLFDLRLKLNNMLADPAMLLLGAAGFSALLGTFNARVESYSGAMWGGITIGVGEGSQGKSLYWNRDPQAAHCEDCLEHGEKKYDGYDELLAQTGQIAPGIGTKCNGNCRCWITVEAEDGEFIRP